MICGFLRQISRTNGILITVVEVFPVCPVNSPPPRLRISSYFNDFTFASNVDQRLIKPPWLRLQSKLIVTEWVQGLHLNTL
ncbi:hypothetical protein VPHK459_0030 [Vibrio phage K459]